MKTCSDCAYWRKEEALPEDFHERTEQEARCGVTYPPHYTVASKPACRDFRVKDSFAEALRQVATGRGGGDK